MCQMIQAASCPYRLYFGIQQDVKHEQDIFDMYQQVSQMLIFSHIRVLTRPVKHTYGPLASLVEMQNCMVEKNMSCVPSREQYFVTILIKQLVSYLPTGHVLTGAGEKKCPKSPVDGLLEYCFATTST